MKRLGLAFAAAALVAGCKKKEDAVAPPVAVASDAVTAEVAPPDAAAAAQTVTFTMAPPTVGEIRDVTDINKLVGTLKAGGTESPLIQHHEEKRTEEVLAVEGPVVTKLKVTYGSVVTHEKMGDEENKGKSPLEGKTFVLSWEKGKLVGRDGTGKVISAELAAQVQGSLSEEVGSESAMGKVLASRSFSTGQRVDLTPDEMKALSPQGSDVTGKGMALTLLERTDDVATLELDGAVTTKQGGMTVDVTLKGTIKLSVSTGRLLEMNMAGQLAGTGGGELTGTMSGTKIFVYRGGSK